ncbi:phosphodiesterase, partial [bacterium]
ILDIAPTIFHLMGFPVPSNFEGGVISEMYAPEFLESNPVTAGAACGEEAEDDVVLSEEESESLRGVLKGFGYL